MLVYSLGRLAVDGAKYASAFELIPGKRTEVGVAANVDGKKVEVVAHARLPFASVTAGTRMILAVRMMKKFVGDGLGSR